MALCQRYSIVFLLLALFVSFKGATPALSGETLDAVKARGNLRCGVSDGIAGFSKKSASGRWVGLDADFCRAVAAAVFGSPEKLTFVPLKSSARFPALQAGKIDLLVRNTTWTLPREAGLRIQFAGILFFDNGAFMVPHKGGVKNIEQLEGATICVEKGTTHAKNLVDFFAGRGLTVRPLVLNSVKEVSDAFFAGRCTAYNSDSSQLAAVRMGAPGGSQAYRFLPEWSSKEPLGPVVRRGDDEWLTVVRWVLFALIAAEEYNLRRNTIADRLGDVRNRPLRRTMGLDGGSGKAMGLRDDWVVRAVQSVGNYGEMFERNVGRESSLQIDRGLNRLWTQGGLMYAPPLY